MQCGLGLRRKELLEVGCLDPAHPALGFDSLPNIAWID